MKSEHAIWIVVAAVVPACLGIAYLMALAGSPQHVWFFRDVLGWI